jgi:hypothetical protein
MNPKKPSFLALASLSIVSIFVGLLALEGILRLSNSSMKNYDIEMWRYARELKKPAANPALGHDHVSGKEATLQSVRIRINKEGLRGPEILPKDPNRRDILFLGTSITLGWGVAEEETVSARVEKALRDSGESVQVMNAGVGNYNAPRYVQRFFERYARLEPTDIVVHYFLRDAQVLEQGGGNWILRNSQLAVTLWNVWHKLAAKGEKDFLEKHYQEVYSEGSPGRIAMEKSLADLASYAKTKNISLTLAMTPDVHDLTNYKFGFIHEMMSKLASTYGYRFVDLYPALKGLKPEEIFSMPGDPHPNGLGHKLMAEAIVPALKGGTARSITRIP